ncbi:YadA-like family protein, partial [Prochlorococcus sp. AH-736-L23]|nr:YadA-like family protein [Prochlorococcus sp. AH-736-L23]
TDTTLACGLGTGTHGGDFAFSGGCASKINNSLSVNYAASITMPGQDYAGDFEDTFSARAGLVWKLGKPANSELISMKEKEFQTKIISLEEKNQELLARLERLEKVALGKVDSKDLASNTINFQELNKGFNFKKISK